MMENMVLRVVITKSSITSKPISHVDKGEDGVEGGHHHVRDGQVQEEVVRHTPHSSVS